MILVFKKNRILVLEYDFFSCYFCFASLIKQRCSFRGFFPSPSAEKNLKHSCCHASKERAENGELAEFLVIFTAGNLGLFLAAHA